MDRRLAQRVKEVFDTARTLPAGERTPWLASACGDGEEGRVVEAEVRDLLASLEESTRFFGDATSFAGAIAASVLAEAASDRAGSWVGPYRIVERIGEGGFGEVYRAEQREPLVREVALKIIKPGMDTREVIARFEQERQALALMDNPGIARVLDAGATPEGRPFFVMELVRGEPITAYCDARSLAIDTRLDLFARVCAAVHHAHQKGIIHRDLKPSNILVAEDEQGRPLPKVIDFGVAKAMHGPLSRRTLLTSTSQMIGTLEYMSPEQARGDGAGELDIDTRADVYSLGAVLYEMLTGTTPFDSASLKSSGPGRSRQLICEVDPPRPSTRLGKHGAAAGAAARRRTDPRRLAGLVRGELDWIVMCCLEKDRERRYSSAQELAEDVGRFLRNEPLHAGPPGAAYRARKFVSRHRRSVATAAAFVLVLLLGLVGTSWGGLKALRARNDARASEADAKLTAYSLGMHAALLAGEQGHTDAMKAALEQVPADLRGWEWDHLRWRSDASLMRFDSPPNTDAIALTPDGATVATHARDGRVRLFDGRSGVLTGSLAVDPGSAPTPYSLRLTHDGGRVMLARQVPGEDRSMTAVWDAASGQRLWEIETTGSTIGAFSVGEGPVWVPQPGRILAVDETTGEPRGELPMAGATPLGVIAMSDGTSLLVHLEGSNLEVWSIPQRRRIAEITAVETSGDLTGAGLMTWDTQHGYRSFDPATGSVGAAPMEQAVPWPFLERAGAVVALGTTGILRAISVPDGGVLSSVNVPASIRAYCGLVTREVVVVLGDDGAVTSWHLGRGHQPVVVEAPWQGMYGAAVDPARGRTAIVGWGDVHLFDAATGEQVWSAYPTLMGLYAAAFSPDGSRLAVAGLDKSVILLDAASGAVTARLPLPEGWFATCLAWSLRGEQLVVGESRGRLGSYDPHRPDAPPVEWPDTHASEVTSIAFSPDGQWAVTTAAGDVVLKDSGGPSGGDGSARLRRTDTGSTHGVLSEGTAGVRAAAFSPDGSLVAVARGRGVALHSIPDGRRLAEVQSPTAVVSLAFNPDGTRLVSSARSLQVRRTADLALLAEFDGAPFTAAIGFTPDSASLIGSSPAIPVVALETGAPPDVERRFATLRARRILQGRFETHGYVADEVCADLAQDPEVPEDIRALAIEQAKARGNDPNRIHNSVWLGLRRDNLTREAAAVLLTRALAAVAAAPQAPRVHTAMAMAACRAEDFTSALAAAERSLELSGPDDHGRRALNWSVIAISRRATGDAAGADKALATAKTHAAALPAPDRDVERWLAEAASAVEGGVRDVAGQGDE